MISECKEIRRNILDISRKSKHGHIPTCFSIVELLYAIYETMRHNPSDSLWSERDTFILSKGHASLAHYCVLAKFGYFDVQRVYSFGAYMSDFGCHADRLKVPGIEASTGSLGHGIGIAAGIALAFKIKKNKRRVFTIIGDGESNEGTVWEAIMVAVDQKLNNLNIICDYNVSHKRGLQIYDPVAHFKGFGCDVVAVDGHDINTLKAELKKTGDTVRVIVANTKKGYGCETLAESHYEWHRKSPNDDEFKKLMRELDEETI